MDGHQRRQGMEDRQLHRHQGRAESGTAGRRAAYEIPHDVGQRGLRSGRHVDRRRRLRTESSLRCRQRRIPSPAPTSLTTKQIGALARELRSTIREHVIGLRREPDDDLTRPAGAVGGGQVPQAHRGLRVRTSAGGSASDFLILDAEMVTGRKSATAAAITTASALAAASSTALRSSSADHDSHDLGAGGIG